MSEQLTYKEAEDQLIEKMEENIKKTTEYYNYIKKLKKYNDYIKNNNITKRFFNNLKVNKPQQVVDKPDCTHLLIDLKGAEFNTHQRNDGTSAYIKYYDNMTIDNFDENTEEFSITKIRESITLKDFVEDDNFRSYMIKKMNNKGEINFDLETFNKLRTAHKSEIRKLNEAATKQRQQQEKEEEKEKDEIKKQINAKKRIVVINELYNNHDLVLDINIGDMGYFSPVFKINNENVRSINDIIQHGNKETGGKRTRRNRKARKSKKARKSRKSRKARR